MTAQERTRNALRKNPVHSEKLKRTLNLYHNRAIATQEIIEELIRLAQDLSAAAIAATNST